MAKIEDIALSFVPYLDERAAAHLLECFGDATSIYAASKLALQNQTGLRSDIAESIINKVGFSAARKQLEHCQKRGVTILSSTDSDYPNRLRYISDYPNIIYMVGSKWLLNSSPLIAIVGGEAMSSYGETTTVRFVEQIAERMPECVIVGLLDHSVDVVAMRCALHHGMKVIGVVNTSLPQFSSKVSSTLVDEILLNGGAIVSQRGVEMCIGRREEYSHHKLVAGLSDAMVVIESSSVLMTAKCADSYSRPLFAVPGRITDVNSCGANMMIAVGMAQMVLSGEKLLDLLDLE